MNQNSLPETGMVSPAAPTLTGSDGQGQKNQDYQLIADAKKRLVDSTTQPLFKGEVTGKHYLVYITETTGQVVAVSTIIDDYNADGLVNPKPAYQRPTGQHSPKVQKGILLDFLCGERVGTIVLYQPENRYQQELVDGGQRVDIIRKFVNNKLTLSGQQAAKFWAYFLPDILHGHQQKVDEGLQLQCNKLLKAIGTNKNIPVVKYETLPYNVVRAIKKLTFDVKVISQIVFKCIEDGSKLTYTCDDYDEAKVIEMVRSKFNKLNLQQKPVQPIHQIWGSRDEYNIKSRGYVETYPGIMSAFGYNLDDDGSSKDEEVTRTFNDLLVRSMLGFDEKVKWGLGIQKVAENLLDAVYDDEIPAESNAFDFINFMRTCLGKVFSTKFSDKNNKVRKVEMAREMVGVGQKAVMQRLYILSLMEFWRYMEENKKASKYRDGSTLYDSMYNYIELLSKVISTITMRTMEKEDYGKVDKPLKKYGLMGMYESNQKLFDNLIRLGGHSQKDHTLVKPTLRSIVELVDEYVL